MPLPQQALKMNVTDHFKWDSYYQVQGDFLMGLQRVAALLCCGDRIDDGTRRDIGQVIQANLDMIQHQELPQ